MMDRDLHRRRHSYKHRHKHAYLGSFLLNLGAFVGRPVVMGFWGYSE